ncbi:PTS sugar transporter subunit IIA [Vagococcus lutrae]|uniref:PTS sugar transporter subunit IIA n=1 Tax=Vagococcus lutrae TaxID=81947 RepID=UPI00200E6EEB|nr:PTS sugar transporter subunit IIA [Vagococcus lutrae]MDY3705405.1 PTS sugar transporter subunit IIA [Vagococcus lutrae]UQF12064.1 PTS sugar transporter subunit IIA [Vagococcus lutrae]
MLLQKKDLRLNQHFTNKEEAIRMAGQLLVDNGYVTSDYIDSMVARDALTSTYIGNMVAIPHGTEGSQESIIESGIVLLQVPNGVEFDGETVKIVIGIAGKGDSHLDLLSNIAIVCSDHENVEALVAATSAEEIIAIFNEGGE